MYQSFNDYALHMLVTGNGVSYLRLNNDPDLKPLLVLWSLIYAFAVAQLETLLISEYM